MIVARSQVWGTLRRYLTYTTAGFAILGGCGAAWSHRPDSITAASADQFNGLQLAQQFVQTTALDTPIWTQRMMAELAPRGHEDAPALATTAPSSPAAEKNQQAMTARTVPDQHVASSANNTPRPAAANSLEVAQLPAETIKTPAYKAAAHGRPPAITPVIAVASNTAPFTARIFTATEFATPDITVPAYSNVAPVQLASVAVDAREPAMRFGFAWASGYNSIADQVAQDIQKVIEVRPGDTLYGVLVDAGVTEGDAKDAVGAISDVFSPRDLRAGQEITLSISTASGTRSSNSDPQLMSLTFEPDVARDVTVTRSNSGSFVAAAVDKELVDANRHVTGVIDSSLFGAAQEAGVPMPVIADLIKTFSFDVDFQRDIQDGDSFELLYERKETAAGDFVKSGTILFASLTLSGKTIPIYYFVRDGEGEYFTPKGEGIRKSLLRTPIDGARITSGFGMRMHPLLGYSKMHKGVDFGAPTGTPIFAAGSGTIVEIGRKSGFGNYIRIRHNGEYQTAYGHMNKFAKGLKKGDRVKQGDVIGYVGATGRATGPHLHYEVLVAGAQMNPSKIKMTSGDKLTGKQLKAFEAQKAKIDAARKRQPGQELIAGKQGDADLSCGIDQGCQN